MDRVSAEPSVATGPAALRAWSRGGVPFAARPANERERAALEGCVQRVARARRRLLAGALVSSGLLVLALLALTRDHPERLGLPEPLAASLALAMVPLVPVAGVLGTLAVRASRRFRWARVDLDDGWVYGPDAEAATGWTGRSGCPLGAIEGCWRANPVALTAPPPEAPVLLAIGPRETIPPELAGRVERRRQTDLERRELAAHADELSRVWRHPGPMAFALWWTAAALAQLVDPVHPRRLAIPLAVAGVVVLLLVRRAVRSFVQGRRLRRELEAGWVNRVTTGDGAGTELLPASGLVWTLTDGRPAGSRTAALLARFDGEAVGPPVRLPQYPILK